MGSKQIARSEQEIFADLATLCALPGYAHAIAMFCFRDNTVAFGTELTADDLQKMHSGSRLVRTEIATLIGLMVRSPVDFQHPSLDTIQDYVNKTESLLEEMHHTILVSGMGFDSWAELARTGKDPFSNGPALREPIFYGGESAYTFQYREFATPKYAADDNWLSTQRGFTIKDAVLFSSSLADILGKRQISHLRSLKHTNPREWTMLPAFTFTATEVTALSGLSPDKIAAILRAFSLPESEKNASFKALNDFNATNAQPILHHGNERYILFQYYSLVESIYESPFYWLCGDREYRDTALIHRGEFTEKIAKDCLLRLFRPENVFANIHLFKGKDEVGEIDALAILGPYAVLLQAKSKRLTVEARKGNDKQIKDDFRKAVQDAVDQAFECSAGLQDTKTRLIDPLGKDIYLKQQIKFVYPVSVVADHYPALAFQARQFLQVKDYPSIAKPLVLDVFALDAMTEMLPSPLYLLSYLNRRNQFGSRVMATHEHTLLSCHLKHNLWVDEGVNFAIFDDDISVHLDAAMAVRREGLPGAREPDGILTRIRSTRVGDLIQQIETEDTEAPIDLGIFLLELNEDAVRLLHRSIKKISDMTLRDSKVHDITIPMQSSGLTIHSSNKSIQETRMELAGHCRLRMYSQKASRWFGVALDPASGKIRTGLKIECPWERDPALDAKLREIKGRSRGIAFSLSGSRQRKIGRNELCICGSGRKYKKCCGSMFN